MFGVMLGVMLRKSSNRCARFSGAEKIYPT
jgi:hypothetical protein